MTALINDVFLRALRREPTPYTPVWLMRQAGRYLPEYNETRRRAGDFMTLCKTPELACEVTLQPLDRYRLDAAILFSDILTIPDAMGLGLHFVEGEGPRFHHPVRDLRAIERLAPPDPTVELRYTLDAVRTIRSALGDRLPLIGFSGSPWTLACYMVEGGASDDFRRVKTLMYEHPEAMHRLLSVNAQAVAAHLAAQAEAGADALMIFDSWGGILADGAYQRCSLDYMRRIIESLRRHTQAPVIVFTKGGGQWLEAIADIGCDAIGLDWTVNLTQARARVGDRCALQGNLDPMALMASPERIREEVAQVLRRFGEPSAHHGHVFNLGHGISRFTPPDHVRALVDAVHHSSRTVV